MFFRRYADNKFSRILLIRLFIEFFTQFKISINRFPKFLFDIFGIFSLERNYIIEYPASNQ